MLDADARAQLDQIAQDSPISLHAVGLSLGSCGEPEISHLRRLQDLVDRYEPPLISDHLSWNAFAGVHLPDLLPLPYTEEALAVVTANVERVQSKLKHAILLENPSKYLALPKAALTEAQFLSEVVSRTGCGVLLDVNNVYVSAINSGSDPALELEELLNCISHQSIQEIHLAGHAATQLENGLPLLVDDHGSRVCDKVWRLFDIALLYLGPRPTLIEWDTRLPELSVLEAQATVAQGAIHFAQRLRENRHRPAAQR